MASLTVKGQRFGRTRFGNQSSLLCKRDCLASNGSKHTARAQQAPSSTIDVRYSRDELYSIPPALRDEIADYVQLAIGDY